MENISVTDFTIICTIHVSVHLSIHLCLARTWYVGWNGWCTESETRVFQAADGG